MRALSRLAMEAIARHDYDLFMTDEELAEANQELAATATPEGGYPLSAVFGGEAEKRQAEHRRVCTYLSRQINRTRFYKWLVVRGKDVEIRTVAVKTRKDGTRCVKEVVRASVGSDTFEVSGELEFCGMGGYVVDWSPEKLGRKCHWSSTGWGVWKYVRRPTLWKLSCRIVNIDVLKKSSRFRYCSYDMYCGDVLDYLKFYVDHPRIELLAKAGAGKFAQLPGFVKRLENDKDFMKWFSKRLEVIKGERHGADAGYMAYKQGIELWEAKHRLDCGRVFRGNKLPKQVDKIRASEYVDTVRGLTPWEYAQYLAQCVRLGMDPADTKVAFPKNFKTRARVVGDRIATIERAERAELAAKLSAELEKKAAGLMKLERMKGAYVVRLPRTELEFEMEEKKLGHCVWRAGYADKVARGECVIVFVRKLDKPQVPFVTVELTPNGKTVRQCYGKNNSRPGDDVLKFVNGPLIKAMRKKAG